MNNQKEGLRQDGGLVLDGGGRTGIRIGEIGRGTPRADCGPGATLNCHEI